MPYEKFLLEMGLVFNISRASLIVITVFGAFSFTNDDVLAYSRSFSIYIVALLLTIE